MFEHALESLLEISAIFRSGEQRPHVERVDLRVLQDFGHFALGNAISKTFGDRCLAHASLADQQGIVLAAPAESLDDALDLLVATDQGINAPGDRRCIEILRVKIERGLLGVGLLFSTALLLFRGGGRLGRRLLADAVGKKIDNIQARDALLLQVIDRMRILFAEDRHQHVGAGDRFLRGSRTR